MRVRLRKGGREMWGKAAAQSHRPPSLSCASQMRIPAARSSEHRTCETNTHGMTPTHTSASTPALAMSAPSAPAAVWVAFGKAAMEASGQTAAERSCVMGILQQNTTSSPGPTTCFHTISQTSRASMRWQAGLCGSEAKEVPQAEKRQSFCDEHGREYLTILALS